MKSLALSLAAFASSLLLLLIALSVPVQGAHLGDKWEATSFCKCVCFGTNYTILNLVTPDNPSKPCLSCTKQWCINQNLPICQGATLGDTDPDTATGKEGDVEARCFQRDSPRDQLVVSLFLLTIFGLLLGAGVKGKMMKAGIDFSVPWTSGKRWWETWTYRAPLQRISLGMTSQFTRHSAEEERNRGQYANVPDNDL